MIIRIWRIVKEKFKHDAFTGEGAAKFGGRWNSIGVPVVYTSESLSLATLEILAGGFPLTLISGYCRFAVEIDASLIETFPKKKLPPEWSSFPASEQCRRIGDTWVREKRSVALKVPSAVVAEEYNYLINPLHPDFGKIIIGKSEKLSVDRRLFKE